MTGFFSRFDRGRRRDDSPASGLDVPPPGRADQTRDVRSIVAEADRRRDSRDFGPAAELYAQALALQPDRYDLRVQLANMLKDSGRLPEAEAEYKAAFAHDPRNADIALQLGRTFKMSGRLAEAGELLARALEIEPDLADAATELLHLGQLGAERAIYARDAHLGRMTSLLEATAELTRLRASIDRALARLPDLATWSAAPAELYGVLRSIQDFPPPPPPPPPPPETTKPLVVVLVDADAGSPRAFHGLLASLRGQSAQEWMLVACGSSPDRAAAVLRAAECDSRFHWAPGGDGATFPVVPADAWVLALRPGGMLHRLAVEWLQAATTFAQTAACILDEEIGRLASDGRFLPASAELRATPDYDAELETPCCGETLLVSPATTASLSSPLALLDPRQRAQLRLHLVREARVAHLPLPLVQSLASDQPPAEAARQAHSDDVRAQLTRHGRGASSQERRVFAQAITRWREEDRTTGIGVIVPTRDNGADVARFADTLAAAAAHPGRVHMLIIDNGSRDPGTLDRLAELSRRPRVGVLRIDAPFNWASLNNRGAAASDSPILLFANDDMTMLSAGWDVILADLLARRDVGVVGARLLYPDDTIQHAGVIAGWQGVVNNDGLRRHVSEPGPGSRWHVTRSVAGVVGAFLATRRETFDTVHGFDAEHLPIAFSDVDYCFKVRTLGQKVLWSPHIMLHHHESKSRGLDYTSPERQARYDGEQAVMEARWPDALGSDPGVNPFWHDATLPFRLLAMPGTQRVTSHLRTSASAEPWRLPPRDGTR